MIELQKIDCNCNDCNFMVRDIEKYKKSLSTHRKWRLDSFEKRKLLTGYSDKFQFNKKEVSINYGRCNKLNKNVLFIPNTCQLETQECFNHRKE